MRCPTLRELPPPPVGKTGWPWTEDSIQAPSATASGDPWPRISIVTPSYNQGAFIEETIRSVLLQGYPDIEYIIIDGGSTDDSVDIIRRYAPWLAFWVTERDGGQAEAINHGFSHTTGAVLGFINSDDSLVAQSLVAVGQTFARLKIKNAIVEFAGEIFSSQGILRTHRPSRVQWLRVWMKTDMSLLQQSTFWTRNLHDTIGGFDETLHFCFDKEFFLQAVFLSGRYLSMPCVVVGRFRRHADSKTSQIDDVKWKENAKIWARYEKDHRITERLRWESDHDRIVDALRSPSRSKALKALSQVLRDNWRFGVSRFFWGAARRILFGNR